MPSLTCTQCGSGIGVHKSWCRDCRNRAGRERYARDPERSRAIKRESMRRIRANHPEKVAAWNANSIGNLRWVCEDANRAKGAMTDDELLTFCRDVALLDRPPTPGDGVSPRAILLLDASAVLVGYLILVYVLLPRLAVMKP